MYTLFSVQTNYLPCEMTGYYGNCVRLWKVSVLPFWRLYWN